MEKKESNPKDIVGSKKPPLSAVPFPVLYEVGAGMLEGALKYGRHNYRSIGVRSSIYFDAAMRHLVDWWEGQSIDPDSGIHHVSKAIATLMVLRDAQLRGLCTDDRPPPTQTGWMKRIQEKVEEIIERNPDPKPPYTCGETKCDST